MIWPPSLMLPVAVRLRPVLSTESEMLVTAGAVLGTRFSKLPPVVPVMVVLMVLPFT
ncbi:hypothetical protein AN403_6264 [Pseudomonas fluorescens]|uniref:Uncharacterized protein n=1 Tax=Pseudomonas fluorescens TaxID=294 RepID=A0A0P8XXL5_PSEFL|nr:hypothetical protein AN403_6264 [Pseudomonas fluorescens]